MQNRLPDIPGLRKNFCRARCNFLTYSRSQPRKGQPLCNQGCEKNLNYLTVCETYIGCAMLREKQWNIFDIPTQYTLQLCMRLVCCSLACYIPTTRWGNFNRNQADKEPGYDPPKQTHLLSLNLNWVFIAWINAAKSLRACSLFKNCKLSSLMFLQKVN